MTNFIQLSILFPLLVFGGVPSAFAEAIIPGLASSELDPELEGMVLIEELNCVACHQSEAPFAGRSKKAPRLSAVGSRVNPSYLESFIRDPHAIKPGTTMPDALAQLARISHKLSSILAKHRHLQRCA